MFKRYLLAGSTLLAITAAQAEDYSSSYTQCMDKASSTVAMGACIQAETKLQDERLNRVYKQLMAKLEGQQQKDLREVQRSWIKYRDGNCAFHGKLSDGSLYRIEGAMCVMDMSKDRAAELERVLSPGQ
ncbi:lysozyme inhibitor LprI family protein [Pseudomonas sichuanensis]|uniref:lysozyme inhibitor LprI family protein n=1 Tax=Pseudomonas sichuanensis TaxID=2213015 RepID=UPI00244CCA4D|nr:lysozyme inhibitor LprI family protein [Pseudomonas sichuanensis]MDH0730018.1 lysozyme inhibitor LprI family protein [Pseudomonas sichuanensis]MDH1584514.1 lysozyme inhibitor LprI family protein [Pseudomonas sichuanensis]MDH1593642.1 lysozyme inhibitor LprI family protein [Pseudomonas sichuanensis]MDH1600177.1 lysozyme inhibitor LprI family protein [Pseudomonas sichuanensis]